MLEQLDNRQRCVVRVLVAMLAPDNEGVKVMFQRVATTRATFLLVCLVSVTGQAAERFYDPIQKAYVFDWKPTSNELSFDLNADPDYAASAPRSRTRW